MEVFREYLFLKMKKKNFKVKISFFTTVLECGKYVPVVFTTILWGKWGLEEKNNNPKRHYYSTEEMDLEGHNLPLLPTLLARVHSYKL